ncbi:unnamed protein product [Chrysoparadoxa australica]
MLLGANATGAGRSHQGMFEKIRAAERRMEDNIAAIDATNSVLRYATWENRTTGVIASRRHREMLNGLKQQEQEALNDRRRELAELYSNEMDAWEEEVKNRVETMEQHKERMRSKALALRDAREADKKKMVQEMYDRQWRDACDDARTLDSSATVKWVASQRWQQTEERKAREEELAKEEASYMEKIQERVAYLAEQEDKKAEDARVRNEVMKADLDLQVQYHQLKKQDLWKREALEEKAELEQIRQELDEEARVQQEKKMQAHEAGKAVAAYNEKRLSLREQQAAEERERDVLLLKYAMAKAAAGDEEERRKKEAEKEAMRKYNEYLKEQAVKEQEDQSANEAIRREAEDRIWRERDRQQQAQLDARNALLKECHEARMTQVQIKQRLQEQALKLDAQQAEVDRLEFIKGEERERELQEKKRRELLDQAAILREQVEARRKAKEAEKQEEYLQIKQMEAFERRHKARLASQAGVVTMKHPRPHTQWYS